MNRYLKRRGQRQRAASLRRELAVTDRELEPLVAARICHDLAQLAVEEGERREAIRWFGQSIDAYIFAGFTSAAAAMCTKLIRYEPKVVRARATLAMLHLAERRSQEAREAIEAYVEATRRLGERAEITEERLLLLASLADDSEVRSLIARSLIEIGASEGGREIMRSLEAGTGTSSSLTEQERWSRLLEAALQQRG